LLRKLAARPQQGPPFYIAFIWLAYMIFPITTLAERPLMEMLGGFLLVIFFAVLYVYGFFYSKGRFLSILVQMVIVGFFVFRYDVNFIYLAFYPSPLIGMMKDKLKISISIAGLLILFSFMSWSYNLFGHIDQLLQLLPIMLVMLAMPLAMRAGSRSRELRAKLNLANEEIAHLSKNEERQRISRDLHDTLGHTLSLITLKSELAEKLIMKNPERAVQEVKDIQATSRAALKQVRELVSGMNAVTIKDEITHAKQILAAAGMILEVKGDMGKGVSAPLMDNILGMCLREAVTNVVKHSGTKVCMVEWAEEAGTYKLMVIDKGDGADMEICSKDASKNGLKGMRERLKLIDGDLQFESSKGEGTSVTFTVPRVAKSLEAGEHLQ
jgi:two-component system sensor histidine kinase DesK